LTRHIACSSEIGNSGGSELNKLAVINRFVVELLLFYSGRALQKVKRLEIDFSSKKVQKICNRLDDRRIEILKASYGVVH